MSARLFIDTALAADQELALPEAAARHVQVLRLQPGEALRLFNGLGGEWAARIEHMGRRDVQVRVLSAMEVDRELPLPVTLAVGMPANERFEWLIEKATELGVAAIEPLVCERSVVRSAAERAQRKLEHWRGVAIAAAEQCGRTRVPRIEPVQSFAQWLKARQAHADLPLLLLAFGDAPVPGARGLVCVCSAARKGDCHLEKNKAPAPWAPLPPGWGRAFCVPKQPLWRCWPH